MGTDAIRLVGVGMANFYTFTQIGTRSSAKSGFGGKLLEVWGELEYRI